MWIDLDQKCSCPGCFSGMGIFGGEIILASFRGPPVSKTELAAKIF